MTPESAASSIHLNLLNKDNLQRPQTRASHTLLPSRHQYVTIADSKPRRQAVYLDFGWLIITTILATANLVASARQATFTGSVYTVITGNRAYVSVAVQVISVALGLIQASAVSQLFNLSTRIRLRRRPTKLGTLQFWNGISSGTIQWNLKPKFFFLLCIYVGLYAVPATIWTGSLTPVVTTTNRDGITRISQYSNMTSIREWPSEIERSGPMLRSEKGFFTYSAGVLSSGLLTQSLSTGTTTDGSPRHHSKFDNSDFTYVGRSYGVGASIGLVDDDILQTLLSEGYTFRETGYDTRVSCYYNTNEEFFQIANDTVGDMLYAAEGYLSDSTGAEYSVYVGHGPDAIVAFGVAAAPVNTTSTTRYVGVAAGNSYANLNTMECKLDMVPSTFNVTVDVIGKNITVTLLDEITTTPDIEPSGNLTHVATRQIELYSNDLTSLYQSIPGNALNFSISDYRTLLTRNISLTPESDAEISLRGVENAFTAMLDDILVSYASAQLMIASDSTTIPATITSKAISIGKPVFVYLVFGLNTLILLLVTEEVVRTRAWNQLPAFDYTNLAHLFVAARPSVDRDNIDGIRGSGSVSHRIDDAYDYVRHGASQVSDTNQVTQQRRQWRMNRSGNSCLRSWLSLFMDTDSRYTETLVLLKEREQEQEYHDEESGGGIERRNIHPIEGYRLEPV